jgi:hypothetical protein
MYSYQQTSPTLPSVVATGGVYKGQGRNQRMLVTFNTRSILSKWGTRSKVRCLVYLKRTVGMSPTQAAATSAPPVHRQHTGRQANPTSSFLSIVIIFRASSGRRGRAEPAFRKMWTSAWAAAHSVEAKSRANLTWSCPRSNTPDSPHYVNEAHATTCRDVEMSSALIWSLIWSPH